MQRLILRCIGGKINTAGNRLLSFVGSHRIGFSLWNQKGPPKKLRMIKMLVMSCMGEVTGSTPLFLYIPIVRQVARMGMMTSNATLPSVIQFLMRVARRKVCVGGDN